MTFLLNVAHLNGLCYSLFQILFFFIKFCINSIIRRYGMRDICLSSRVNSGNSEAISITHKDQEELLNVPRQ